MRLIKCFLYLFFIEITALILITILLFNMLLQQEFVQYLYCSNIARTWIFAMVLIIFPLESIICIEITKKRRACISDFPKRIKPLLLFIALAPVFFVGLYFVITTAFDWYIVDTLHIRFAGDEYMAYLRPITHIILSVGVGLSTPSFAARKLIQNTPDHWDASS